MDPWRFPVWGLRLVLLTLIGIRLVHLARGKRFAREELTGRESSDVPYLVVEALFLALSFTAVDPFFAWVGTGPLPQAAAHSLFLLGIVIHELGHALRLYRSMVFHFAAHASISFCIGVCLLFGLFHGDITARAYLVTLGTVFAIGVGWEFCEMVGTQYLDAQAWYHNWDMVLDVVGNTLGGASAVMLGHIVVTGGLAFW